MTKFKNIIIPTIIGIILCFVIFIVAKYINNPISLKGEPAQSSGWQRQESEMLVGTTTRATGQIMASTTKATFACSNYLNIENVPQLEALMEMRSFEGNTIFEWYWLYSNDKIHWGRDPILTIGSSSSTIRTMSFIHSPIGTASTTLHIAQPTAMKYVKVCLREKGVSSTFGRWWIDLLTAK